MKDEIINLIKILGFGYTELIADMKVGMFIFNSIEYNGKDVILHIFLDKIDVESNWDNLTNKQKKIILIILRPLLYN